MGKRFVDPFELASEITEKTKPGILLTTKAGDKVNTMVIGWGHIGVVWNMPIYICFVRDSRYTFDLLGKNPEFTINVQQEDRLRPDILQVAGFESGRDVDKVEKLGLTLVEPEVVSVPAIKECPITLECEMLYRQELDADALPEEARSKFYRTYGTDEAEPKHALHTMFFGKIVSSYVVED